MAYPNRFRRRPGAALDFRLGDVSWGVKRRPGFSEFDDPRAHEASMAHAFVSGNDALAICGYKPFKLRRSSSVCLAAPSEQNPECERCRSALQFAVAPVVQADVAGLVQTTVGPDMVDEPSPLLRLAEYFDTPVAVNPMRRRRASRTTRRLGPVELATGRSRRRSQRRAKARAIENSSLPLYPELAVA